jgi:hypothetical protein
MSVLPPEARLVAPLPDCPHARLALFTVRRMGAHGLADAQAAMAMLDIFGLSFRRPLLLTRIFLSELAATARRTIAVAPCCCLRMTGSEQELLVLLAANADPAGLRLTARMLLGSREVDNVLATAAAVSAAYADAGRPLAV